LVTKCSIVLLVDSRDFETLWAFVPVPMLRKRLRKKQSIFTQKNILFHPVEVDTMTKSLSPNNDGGDGHDDVHV
jgi:hypothetical protein